MKIERWISVVLAITVVILLWMQFGKSKGIREHKSINGTNLKLVAKYEPLRIYIYADTTPTNKHPDYAIFQGNNLIDWTVNTSNTVEISLSEKSEKGFRGNLMTDYDHNGQILKRTFTDNLSNVWYVDTNADGLWDRFITHDKTSGKLEGYIRSNLCWVQIQQK